MRPAEWSVADAVKALFWGAVVVLAFVAGAEYPGNVAIYAGFTVVSSLFLYAGFRKNAIFFDTFIGILLWLGFWLRFSVRTAFMDGHFPQAHGAYDGSAVAADQTLLISTCGLLALLLASGFRSRFMFNYRSPAPSVGHAGLQSLYERFRIPVLVAFVLVILAVGVSNAWLGIYQRGEVPRTVLPFRLGGVYTWLLLFGLAAFSALILHFELSSRGRITWLTGLVALLECFCSNVSLLSRGMVLNGSALFYGVWRSARLRRIRLSPRFAISMTTLFIVLFAVSVLLVNFLRAPDAVKKKAAADPVASIAKSNRYEKLAGLVLDRWVGVEGVMAVQNYPDPGWKLWSAAWAERYDVTTTSFFDLNLLIKSPYRTGKVDSTRNHYISLPGVIAFFFYPGSYAFLFVSMFALGLLAAVIEFSAYRLGGANLILCALIAQVVAYRYSSFGYVPRQSYMLFGTIYLNLILIWLGNRLALRFVGPDRRVVDAQYQS